MAKSLTNTDMPVYKEGAPEFDPVAPAADEYTGQYRKLSDGLVYGLVVKDDDHLGRTHKARCPKVEPNEETGDPGHYGYFWEGDKTQFRAQFDKA